ncbi:MAG: carboxylesterase family protein [Tannerellaceae bacterium]|jgi:para-nitrobenzyl esterase|nr:carboxylesterase family protein [Tannerellaceae bacterium]
MNRRNFVKKTGLGTVATFSMGSLGATITSCSQDQNNSPSTDDAQALFIGDDIAIANTTYGKVRGYIMNDIYTFLGIPYGADTSGINRFMPPKKPKPWNDIRPAVFYGDSAPQRDPQYPNQNGTFVDHWNYYNFSENCLMINVWTPSITDRKKRPVLVWLHGGGFTAGSGIEQDGYHGENISKRGDIVFCSINHRLGPIGFSDLSGVGGEKYKHSGNVGVLDIIAALEWVKENMADFGGDPDNITIMGQSGGGAKVSAIANMPAAKSLVSKAVCLSGSSIEAKNQETSRLLGTYILKEAGLRGSETDKLQTIPWKEYLEIANRALARYNQEHPNEQRTLTGGFAPVADGIHIPKGTYFSDPASPDVPMIYCTTFEEWSALRDDPAADKLTKEDIIERIKGNYKENAGDIYEAYAKCFPHVSPGKIWLLILGNRKQVIDAAHAKLKQTSPVYVAWFGWQPPLFNNRMGAFHCLDICFWFGNTDRMVTHTGGGSRPRKLSYKMMDALLAFMQSADPDNASLPHWDKFTEEEGKTMILNDICELKSDPDREARMKLG